MYVCSAVYKDRLTVNHSRKFVEHQDINAQRSAHIHAMQCQMAADVDHSAWITTVVEVIQQECSFLL